MRQDDPNANYIPSVRLGLMLGLWELALGQGGFALGLRGFSDTNILVSASESVTLGARPNAKPQREWFCVAVEYRLNTHLQ